MIDKNMRSAIPSIIWALYYVLSINLLFFELPVFDEHFKTEIEYLYVLMPLLVCFIVLNKIAVKIPIRILSALNIGCFIGLSLIWYLIAYNLPVPMANFGCDSFICEKYGQIALVVVNFGILLPFLNEWTLKIQERGVKTSANIKTLIISLALISQGLISIVDYYWVPFSTFIISMISIILLSNFAKKIISMPKSDNHPQSYRTNKLVIYNNRFFKDILFLAFISLFGFSMLDHNKFLFDSFIPIGAGVFIFDLISRIYKLYDPNQTNKYLLDGVVYLIALLTQLILFELIYTNLIEIGQNFLDVLNEMIIVICISTGIYIAYLFDRTDSLIQRADYPIHQNYFIHYKCKILSKYGADISTMEFMFLLWFVISLIKVRPEGEDIILIYGIGALALVILLILWISDLYKSLKCIRSRI